MAKKSLLSMEIPSLEKHENIRLVLQALTQDLANEALESKTGAVIVQAMKAATSSLQASIDKQTAEDTNAKIAAVSVQMTPEEVEELEELQRYTEERAK